MTLGRQTRTGRLDLHFGVRGGQTVLLRDLQKAPLMVVRPFTLPCGTLMVFIVNPTGGVLGGDHSQIEVQVEAGARVLLLTQSATRIQPGASGEEAVQDLRFTVAAGARLEYYPERTIPFAGSRFRQTIHAELEDGAEFGATETLATGRVHSGERLAFVRYHSSVEVWQAGRRVYLDRQHLQPGPQTRAPGVLEHSDYAASGVWVGTGEVTDWPSQPCVLATGRSRGRALWLRAVAASGLQLDQVVNPIRDCFREQLFNAPVLQVRR